MLDQSAAYQAAITGDARRILLQAVIDIISPDITYGTLSSSGQAAWSNAEQGHDKVFTLGAPYATLERNRWMMDGSAALLPDDPAQAAGQVGIVLDAISGADGSFAAPPWVEQALANVSILQACSVFFSDRAGDGVAEDFTVEVKQGGTAYFTQQVTGNTKTAVSFTGFTVYNPDAIRVTVQKWSLPSRRPRLPEILPGVHEEWDNDMIAEFEIQQQANFACLALPYGTCTLTMDNLDRRFEPRNKTGVFQSIEERQGIDISVGVVLEDGTTEQKHVGIFYQYSGGWRTSDNNMTMTWKLVDIVGLLAGREFIPPATLPTTLGGWVAVLVAQLGANFEGNYTVDANYADTALTISDASELTGKTCGEILRWACMASGTWPRADAETGYLAVEPFWSQGNRLTLDNLESYPTMKANDDLAAIIFTLADEDGTQYIVSGNSTASSNTVSVKNPFIRTEAAALTAARQILSTYGGIAIETRGRGDPSSEIGDVSTIELDESSATTGRLQLQTLTFADGVLTGCKSAFLQADGSFQFSERAVITADGTWTAPAGVSQLRCILVGGGAGGTSGTDGTWDEAGVGGTDGAGGRVLAQTININEQQTFAVVIGKGGAAGQSGTATTFGAYSSANGRTYSPSYTDVSSGDAFGRTGVVSPMAGTGDGGAKGAGGVKGNRYTESYRDYTVNGTLTPESNKYGVYLSKTRTVIANYPGTGTAGKSGADGCVVIYWEKVDA